MPEHKDRTSIKPILAILNNPLPDQVIAEVTGNAPRAVKEAPIKAFQLYHRFTPTTFAGTVTQRLRVSEVNVGPSVDEPTRNECRVVSEMTVEEDMVGMDDTLSQGCMALLIDESSAASTAAYFVLEGQAGLTGFSQSLNIFFHTTVKLGAKIRIIARALGGNEYTVTCRGEIWDSERHRMIAHGEQVMMPMSGKWKSMDELAAMGEVTG